jgi:hypothetical protein
MSPRTHTQSGFHGGFHGGGFHGGGFHGGGFHGGGFHGGGRFFGGWGWYNPWWGWPYGYYPSLYRSGEEYRTRWTAVKTDVEPDEAALYLDGKLIGSADDFDGFPDRLYLGRGHYRLEFRLPGYETYSTEIDAAPGRSFRIDQHLKKVPGAKQHGTYESARPEGGIVRFFAKRGSSAEPQSPEAPEGGPGEYREEYRHDRDEMDDQEADARLFFEVEPAEAAIYIDGRFAGGAQDLNSMDEGFVVEPGEHHITVVCPGYRESTLVVTAGGRKTTRVRLSLSR